MKEKLMPTTVFEPPELTVGRKQQQQYEFDLLDVAILLARRKFLILKITAIAMVLALIVTLLLPSRFTAKTVIMPPQQTQSASSMLMNQLAGSGLGSLAALAGKDIGLKKPDDLYIGILESRTIQDELIRRFGLQGIYHDQRLSDARRELERSTTIFSGKDGLISIAVEDTDPNLAVQIANAYVTELRQLLQHLAVSEAGQRRLFFEQQLQQTKEDLATAEVALKETQQKTGMLQLDSQSRAIIEAIGRIRAQIAAKEVQLHAMGAFATEQNPDYIVAREELNGLRAQLTKYEQQSPDSADPVVASGKIPTIGLEYVRRVREVKYREAMFELMAKQYEAAKLDEAKEAAIVQVVDPALKPDKKSSPKISIFLPLAAMLGLIGAVGYVLLSAALAVLRRDPRQATRLREFSLSLGRKRT